MGEKVTLMVVKVDLQCPSCYKKVKKVLCKFPQIRDQVYNEKQNTVMITVVCCKPEKIRDKLCCKGAPAIKSIEIKEPPKPNAEKPKSGKPPKADKPESPTRKPPKPESPPGKPPKPNGPAPTAICCGPCSQGYGGGPCYTAHGRPVQPPPPGLYYEGYGYRYQGNKSCCDYFSEENPQGCAIM